MERNNEEFELQLGELQEKLVVQEETVRYFKVTVIKC